MAATDSDIRSRRNGGHPGLDLSSVSTPARAKIPVTIRIGNLRSSARRKIAGWWGWTTRPPTLRELWAASKIDRRRIPADSTPLRALWAISNATDRLLLLALILAVPTCLQAPLRAIAVRPTRRLGTYLIVALLGALALL